MSKRVALIAGVTGAIGAALASHLSKQSQWTVRGISRRVPTNKINGVEYIQADLRSTDFTQNNKSVFADVTHVYYCGRATHAEQVLEDPQTNLLLLRNLVQLVEREAAGLQHVHLVQGGKYYGVHIGPFPVPAREQDPRAPIDNFNYDQQDFLQECVQSAQWNWTASRPNTLVHYSPSNGRNLVSTLGTYAVLCREHGSALDFPGAPGAWDSITQVTSMSLLTRGIEWMSTTPECSNQAFNMTNTDVFRWCDLWPKLAQAFDIPVGTIRPMRLTDVMAERDSTWKKISQQNRLTEPTLDNVAHWGYADATLERYWDEILCHNTVRALGFDQWDNSEQAFFNCLQQYRDAAILPA